jgi:glycosyltransferase involved in cell wall biosynthesis
MQLAKESGIADHINFMGFQQKPASYMAQSDIIILPSLFEPFGLVYIEAFALMVPVIAFDTQACNELINNNETGILVKIFDIDELAAGIIHLLNNPQERQRLAEAAYRSYTTHFNSGRMIAETVAWYRSVIKG